MVLAEFQEGTGGGEIQGSLQLRGCAASVEMTIVYALNARGEMTVVAS
jgi:hypothetical protein